MLKIVPNFLQNVKLSFDLVETEYKKALDTVITTESDLKNHLKDTDILYIQLLLSSIEYKVVKNHFNGDFKKAYQNKNTLIDLMCKDHQYNVKAWAKELPIFSDLDSDNTKYVRVHRTIKYCSTLKYKNSDETLLKTKHLTNSTLITLSRKLVESYINVAQNNFLMLKKADIKNMVKSLELETDKLTVKEYIIIFHILADIKKLSLNGAIHYIKANFEKLCLKIKGSTAFKYMRSLKRQLKMLLAKGLFNDDYSINDTKSRLFYILYSSSNAFSAYKISKAVQIAYQQQKNKQAFDYNSIKRQV